jgi:hypothetical protein
LRLVWCDEDGNVDGENEETFGRTRRAKPIVPRTNRVTKDAVADVDAKSFERDDDVEDADADVIITVVRPFVMLL